MKRIFLLPMLALAFACLGACNAPGLPGASAGAVVVDGSTALPGGVVYQNKTIATVDAAIAKATAATLAACKYRPQAAFLLKVAATFTNIDEALAYTDQLAYRICIAAGASVPTVPPTAYSSLNTREPELRAGTVRGVPVAGHFVK